jgi:uncharacterized protein (TIRG00374 family)
MWPLAIRLLRYFVPFGILGFLFTKIPVADVRAVLGRSQWVYLVLAIFVWLFSHWIVAYRLKLLVDALGSRLSVRELFGINAATSFYGLFLPGGNVTRFAIRLYKITKIQKNYAEMALAVLLDRAITTLTLCVVGSAFWLGSQPAISASVLLMTATVLILMLTLVMVLTGKVSVRTPSRLRAAMERTGGRPLERLREAIARAGDMPCSTLVNAFGLSVLIHLMGTFSYLLIAWALSMDLSFVLLGWVRPGLILATMIPVSVGGLGLREVASLVLLTTISNDEAVAFSLLVFVVTILPLGLLGGIYATSGFFRERREQTVAR